MQRKMLFYVGYIIFILVLLSIIKSITIDKICNEENIKIYDSKVKFKHFDFELNNDNTMKQVKPENIVNVEFNTIVIENKYLVVTLLPEYGGRVLSMIYKPTGHELLYQNPIGTVYGVGENFFYYNWLMVYGGIFPTFPEPEHGKAWFLPWEYRVTEKSNEKISVEMSFTDNIDRVEGVPVIFKRGKTNIKCVQTVTIYKNKSFLEYNIKLINNNDTSIAYEYWTCATLAPGSVPGKTNCPSNSEIIAPINEIKVRDDWWPWMSKAEKSINVSNHVYEYRNLAYLKNWEDMGIAYAYPSMEKEWWGVINHENEEGILRIANNRNITKGLKFWTWGDEKGRTSDPENFNDMARPYIELWAGHSDEFFEDSIISPMEQKSWNEYYIPTVGLNKITFANMHAAVNLGNKLDNEKDEIVFSAEIFTTHPEEILELVLTLKGEKNMELLETKFKADPIKVKKITVHVPHKLIERNYNSYELMLKTLSGELLVNIKEPLELEGRNRI